MEGREEGGGYEGGKGESGRVRGGEEDTNGTEGVWNLQRHCGNCIILWDN